MPAWHPARFKTCLVDYKRSRADQPATPRRRSWGGISMRFCRLLPMA